MNTTTSSLTLEAEFTNAKKMIAAVGLCWFAINLGFALLIANVPEMVARSEANALIMWFVIWAAVSGVLFFAIQKLNIKLFKTLPRLESQDEFQKRVQFLKRISMLVGFFGPLLLYFLIFLQKN